MKIVIFTVDHIYANRIVKELIKEFGREISLVVESGVLLHNRSLPAALKKYLQTSGFYYVLVQAVKLELYKSLSKICTAIFPDRIDSKFYSFRKLAKRNSIKVVKIFNVNNEESRKILSKEKPDIFVSVFFNQILKSEIISISRLAVLNIHPAYLPDYKGVSPVFWALVNGEKKSGVSVHFIDRGIDTGGIIKKEQIKIDGNDTEDSLYWKAVLTGAPLLVSAINEIKEKKNVEVTDNKGGRYFSLPTKEAVEKFRKNRSFFNIKNYILR